MAAGFPETNIDLLKLYRDKDEKTVEQEVIPEKQTLNGRNVNEFMARKGMTRDNFEKLFNLNTAIELVGAKHSRGEAEMFNVLGKAKTFLDQRGVPNLFENMNDKTVKSNIAFELGKRNELNRQPEIEHAYYTYRTVREYCEKMLKIREESSKQRGREREKVESSLKGDFAGVIEGVKKNFGNMSSGEKLITVGGILIGLVMLAKSESPRVAKIKEALWTCVKIAGVGYAANTIFKVFTGKTALDSISDWSKSSVAKESFWTRSFKTEADKAEILRTSMVYLNDKDFLRLAGEYQHAKSRDIKRIVLPTVDTRDMTPEQIYTALEVFFQKYPVERLMQKYRQYKPRPTWAEVVSTEMVEDGTVPFDNGLVDRTVDAAHSAATRGYNEIAPPVGKGYEKVKAGVLTAGVALKEAVGGTWEWTKNLFHKTFGRKGSDAEVKEWVDKALKNDITQSADLEKFIREKNGIRNSEGYVNTLARGQYDATSNLKYFESADSMYVIADSKVNNILGDQSVLAAAMKNADSNARNFLKKKYPLVGNKIDTFAEFSVGVYVISDATYKVFMRMPLPGTEEFNLRNAGRWTPKEMAQRKGIEIFGPKNSIEYNKLQPWEQQRFRARFYLDNTQQSEINQVCDYLSRRYRNAGGLSIEFVMQQMFENDKDRDDVFRELKFDRKLYANRGLLEAYEKKITDLEKDAASDVPGSKDAKKSFEQKMRNLIGYPVRLAILGDSEAMPACNYDPTSTSKDVFKTPNELLKWYKKRLKELVPKV